MGFRRRLIFALTFGALIGSGLSYAPQPVSAASYLVVDNPPCTPTGVHASVTNGGTPREDAYLKWCASGGYFYVRPVCGIQSGADKGGTGGPAITFDECYVFIWTTGGSYVTRYGFSNFNRGALAPWTEYYYEAAGTLRISGYKVSSEVCGHSFWTPSGDYYVLGCVQSATITPS